MCLFYTEPCQCSTFIRHVKDHEACSVDGENRPLVTDELVELKNNWFRFKTAGKLQIHLEDIMRYSSI
jgi:hypothetical protein